jgi:hypothetical protein
MLRCIILSDRFAINIQIGKDHLCSDCKSKIVMQILNANSVWGFQCQSQVKQTRQFKEINMDNCERSVTFDKLPYYKKIYNQTDLIVNAQRNYQ